MERFTITTGLKAAPNQQFFCANLCAYIFGPDENMVSIKCHFGMIIIIDIKTMSLVLDTKMTLSSVVWRNGKLTAFKMKI